MIYKEALIALKYKRSHKFILEGSEQFLKEHFVKKAKKIYSDLSCLIFFPGDELEIIDVLHSYDMFPDNFIVIFDFDKIKTDLVFLIKNFKSPLILSLSNRAKSNSKAVSKIAGICSCVECRRVEDQYIVPWIKDQILELDYTYQDGVDQLIYSKTGSNLYVIHNELEKLFICKEDKFISIDDVNKIITNTIPCESYDIFDCLLNKDIKGALFSYENYVKSNEDLIGLIIYLELNLEKMLKILLWKEKKLDLNEISEKVGINSYFVKNKYYPKISLLGKNLIMSKISQICEIDIEYRLFKSKKSILIEKFILNFLK